MSVMRSLLLAGSQNEWLRHQAMHRAFVRRAVSRFMPGTTPDDALRAADTLRARSLATILTHLGENITTPAEAAAVERHYLDLIARLPATGPDTEVSVKLTQLGLDQDLELAVEHTVVLAHASAAQRRRLWIDMEASPYVERTLEVFRRVRERQPLVGLALQAYLHRTAADLEPLAQTGAAIRMVKGAYQEPPDVAMPRKADVDASFFRLCDRMFADDARAAGAWVTIGTHDRTLITALAKRAEERGVPKDGYEFAMLYGIQTTRQQELGRAGIRTRCLISYGEYWFPWYMRRLGERPANVWFVVKNIFR